MNDETGESIPADSKESILPEAPTGRPPTPLIEEVKIWVSSPETSTKTVTSGLERLTFLSITEPTSFSMS